MIQNLISAVLVSLAVGGNTAAAFNKEPQQRINYNGNSQINIEFQDTDQDYDYMIYDITYGDDLTRQADTTNKVEYRSKTLQKSTNYTNIITSTYTKNVYERTNSRAKWYGVIYSFIRISLYQTQYFDEGTISLDVSSSYRLDTAQVNYAKYTTQISFINTAEIENLYLGAFNDTPTTETEWTQISNYAQDFEEDAESYSNWTRTEDNGTYAEWQYQGTPYENNSEPDAFVYDNYSTILVRTEATISMPPDLNTRVTYDEGFYGLNNVKLKLVTYPSDTPIVYEIIDIPNLMYTIMTMPFSFVSQAFNLTLFPNTPYELNIRSIILLILTILIVMFITKIVSKFIK